MIKNYLCLSLALILSMLYSCKDEPVGIILTTSSDVLNLNPINGSQSLSITSNSAWTVSSPVKWFTLSDSTGTGNKSIVFLCQDNLSGKPREATISIQAGNQSKSMIVRQDGGKILIEESFNDNSMNWIILNSDSLSENINNGVYIVKNTSRQNAYFVGTRSIITNYTGNYMITSKYNTVSGSQPFGLVFGFKDNLNFYRLLIYPWGAYTITKRLNGTNISVLTGSVVFSKSNTIGLVKIGKNCDIYINDSKINNFDLSTPFGAYVGFYSCPQTEINIDYLKVVQF